MILIRSFDYLVAENNIAQIYPRTGSGHKGLPFHKMGFYFSLSLAVAEALTALKHLPWPAMHLAQKM